MKVTMIDAGGIIEDSGFRTEYYVTALLYESFVMIELSTRRTIFLQRL